MQEGWRLGISHEAICPGQDELSSRAAPSASPLEENKIISPDSPALVRVYRWLCIQILRLIALFTACHGRQAFCRDKKHIGDFQPPRDEEDLDLPRFDLALCKNPQLSARPRAGRAVGRGARGGAGVTVPGDVRGEVGRGAWGQCQWVMVVVGGRLAQVILEGFSNLNRSVVLCLCHQFQILQQVPEHRRLTPGTNPTPQTRALCLRQSAAL